ncbi:hypothetical protein ANAEL_05025 [Anaerolineales bacterium]|nr:hypothetical protein ANAEL_05025 [Anaerolineales bacterium]
MMDVLSRLALEWIPISLTRDGRVVADVFKHSLSAMDGLPPYSQARIIELISNRLLKARPRPCLWVSVDAPGSWYFNEMQRFVKPRIPTVILPEREAPKDVWDFSPHGYPSLAENVENPRMELPFTVTNFGYKPNLIRVLRILARLKAAHRPEIASLTGLSQSQVRNLLQQLQAKGLIERRQIGKYEGWAIRTRGLSLAHRSWNIPKGVHFTKYRGEFRYAGERHRRVSRLWRAWLGTAYPSIEIWESWTEVPLQYGIPDALAWGSHRGKEILFWLEVDSGHSSRKTMEANYKRRLQLAYAHASRWGIPIVFCIMGPLWIVEHFRWCIPGMSPQVAIIGHDWRDSGNLPEYEFGKWREKFSMSRFNEPTRSHRKLPFDPNQYPPKPKKVAKIKPPKPKSVKPKFSTGSENVDRGYRRRSEGEE